MKVMNVIIKVALALAALAGIVYVVATYGDKIVAWAKKMLGSCKCCCSGEDECCCEDACCEEECFCDEAAEELPAEEEVAEEAAVEEAPAPAEIEPET